MLPFLAVIVKEIFFKRRKSSLNQLERCVNSSRGVGGCDNWTLLGGKYSVIATLTVDSFQHVLCGYVCFSHSFQFPK